MSVITAFSAAKEVQAAVREMESRLTEAAPRAVLYFASPAYPAAELASAMQAAFPGAAVFGCTTAGEIVSGRMMKGSVVAMAFGADVLEDITLQVVPHVSSENHVREAFAAFAAHYGTPPLELDPAQYVGIVLCDGLSRAEEKIIDAIGNETNVTFIGGSAGDDLAFKQTMVFAHGAAHADAAVLALIKPAARFDFIKTQSFCAMKPRLTATKVDEEQRMVLEFNHRPAIEAYAEAIGKTPAEAGQYFMRHPLGLMVEGEPYVRSPQQAQGGAMVFYCQVKEGMELTVLETQDIIADTAAAIRDKEQELGKIQGIVNFHCILRTLELEHEGRTEEYGQVFSAIPTIGFSTYGEAYIGHINQTATMLIFA